MRIRSALISSVLLFVGSCSEWDISNQASSTSSYEKESLHGHGLTQEEAEVRFSQVEDVHYDINLKLDDRENFYSGMIILDFDLLNNDLDLRVDFRKGEVTEVNVNKTKVEFEYNNQFIRIGKNSLNGNQRNQIEIKFKHGHSTSGSGLHRFQDPVDQKVYLYTDFEPFDANEFIPCFDQPDLRATYKLSVEAPKDWEVISSVREDRVEAKKDFNLWKFKKSLNFSTYIFSLHAGPYKKWLSTTGKIPLRLFARQSLAKYVEFEEWFKITKQGFRFFENYFDYPYPFEKYDQIIVPDFNAGAMENVGAVTFAEKFVYRSKPTYEQREDRGDVILHEMAHMWFGNLVTMKWWNGLWLNESFATFMAALALVEGTEFKHSWQSFYTGMKQWAYWEDQLVTTHPIEVSVFNTMDAFSNFDGITYGKGASVLKQLHYLLGPKNFRDGIRYYFKKYAYSNTHLSDFFGAMEAVSKRDLGEWTKTWLKTAGLNSVKADFSCDGNNLKSFALIQTAPKDHPQLRTHKTIIGFLNFDQTGQLSRIKKIPATYEGERTELKINEKMQCPDVVYPNYDDQDFVKVVLDEKSIATIKKNLGSIKDPLLRQQFWLSFWEMVRDGELNILDFVQIALSNLGSEKDANVLAAVIKNIVGRNMGAPSVLKYLSLLDKKNGAVNSALLELESLFWKELEKSRPKSDMQKIWLDGYIRTVQSESGLRNIYQILTGEVVIKGIEIDQDRRWNIIGKLNQSSFENSFDLAGKELEKDPSDKGEKSYIAVSVSRPDSKVKEDWMNKVNSKDTKLPLSKLQIAMWGMFPPAQLKFFRELGDRFFYALPELAKIKDEEFLSEYSSSMAPAYCDEKSSVKLNTFINQMADELPKLVIKELKVVHQENQRCTKILSHFL